MSEERERPIVDWPTYWFLLLEKSLANGDLDGAAESNRQLKRLGVTVVFCCEPKRVAVKNDR